MIIMYAKEMYEAVTSKRTAYCRSYHAPIFIESEILKLQLMKC